MPAALAKGGQLSICSPLSYCLRFSGSRSTSYAFRSFLNRPSAFALCSSLFCNKHCEIVGTCFKFSAWQTKVLQHCLSSMQHPYRQFGWQVGHNKWQDTTFSASQTTAQNPLHQDVPKHMIHGSWQNAEHGLLQAPAAYRELVKCKSHLLSVWMPD